ncbi:androgen-induced gene 1 protein-like isoform X2 [Haliotis rufescens]|uniref:androgen-induced gene 1 protein-like isoform X2 n=1 Tax=Haliotis rufescens TaxID=6454 RepID=UPI00201F80F4|nr:androgen-induced gene 1 protein-like isoform X2 [Haliotis rufescens]
MDAVQSALFLAFFVGYSFSVWWDVVKIPVFTDGVGGKLMFLTFWNALLQTFYYGLCAVTAIVGSTGGPIRDPRKRSALQKFRDFLHNTLAFPVGTFVVVTFWAIYAVDRELVFPKALDQFIPPWLNHVMHTFILPILLLDKYLNYHHLPKRRNGILGLLLFGVIYLIWILWIAYHANVWVYPILKVLETHQRIIFFGFLLMLFVSLYLLGEGLTRFLWRKELGANLAARNTKSSKSNKKKNR